jgi:hypothetical protein
MVRGQGKIMKAALMVKRVRGHIEATSRMELRRGAKGTGEVLWSVQYWTDSPRASEAADAALAGFLRQHPEIEVMDNENWMGL